MKKEKPVIGVMGPGDGASKEDKQLAYEIGKAIAGKGWYLLTGGRKEGVMHFASKGAKEAGGLVTGILPGSDQTGKSEFVDIAIVTGMGSARNMINVLSSDVIVACGIGAGTLSEISLAVKVGKPVGIIGWKNDQSAAIHILLGEKVSRFESVNDIIYWIDKLLN